MSERTAEEQHLLDKEKHNRRLAEKNRRDHTQRTSRMRRIFARIRDHVRSTFGN